MRTPTKNWRKRRTNHRFYAEIVTDITLYLMLCTSRIGHEQQLLAHYVLLGYYNKLSLTNQV